MRLVLLDSVTKIGECPNCHYKRIVIYADKYKCEKCGFTATEPTSYAGPTADNGIEEPNLKFGNRFGGPGADKTTGVGSTRPNRVGENVGIVK